jgi:hypothetical protein
LRSSAKRTKRPVRNGSVPPLWENIQRMSGNFIAVPLNTRWAMVRVVSVAYSIEDGGMPGTSPWQQSGEVGWT